MSQYRTPLRYPGGKQRLAGFVAEILECNDAVGWNYVEPYAGGAGIAMELLIANKVKRVFLNDSSFHVYAFWKAIVGDAERFCRRVSRAALTLDAWRKHREVMRHPEEHSLFDVGFSTFYLNRCNRSGILTAGVIGGLEQVGRWRIDARYMRNELIRRIETIAEHKDRIVVSNLDAEAFMVSRANKLAAETLVYCDPPYYERAKRLYLNSYKRDDHVRLARVIQQKLHRPWLVSYDGHPNVIALYRGRRRFRYSLYYSAVRAHAGTEVFVFSDALKLPRTSSIPYIAAALRYCRRSA